jgi:hypothetical protein
MQAESYRLGELKPSLLDYIIHFFKLYIEALKPNLNSLIILVFLTVIVSIFLQNRTPNSISINFKEFIFKKDKFLDKILSLISSYKWLIVAIFCLAVYWPTMLYGYRYYIGFYYFLVLALLFFLYKVVKKTDNEHIESYSFKKFLVPLILIVTFSFFYFKTLSESIIVSAFMKDRINKIELHRGNKSVEVEALDFSTFTRSVRTSELSLNCNYVTNQNYSNFFNIDSIKVSNFLTKEELKKKSKK